MLFEILFGVFILVSLLFSILLFYSLKRINFLENVIVEFKQIIDYSSEKLKIIDNTGHFESDDEVGFIFGEMKQLQELLSGLFENEIEEDSVSAEENEKN